MDPMRLLSEMRLPVMDVEALAAAQRRNLEALSAANRVALEGAQAVARRHMEILQQSMSEMTDAVRGTSASDPQARAAKQAEMLKSTYERAVTNMKELADLIQKSNSEALTVLNKRFAEAMDEVRGMVAKKEG
jgi:phasin family protein